MKAFVVLTATVLMSVSAMALGPESSWSEILRSKNTVIEHAYQGAMAGISLGNACVTETTVQTIRDVRTCNRLVPVERGGQSPYSEDGRYTDWVCAEYGKGSISTPRTYTVPECTAMTGGGEAGSECVRWSDRSVTIPDTVKVTVWKNQGESTSSFSKYFTFPACE